MLEQRIGIVDYVTMFGLVLLCTGIGLYHSRKSKKQLKNVEGYLLGSRSMSIVPVAFSILATKLSGISISGATGEEYLYGPMYSGALIGYCIGQFLVAIFVVPVFRQGHYISMYEYLERRFDKSVRYLFSVMYFVSNMFYVGIVMYIPAVSVTALTGLPFEVTVVITVLTCTLYCVTGGFTAVVWTDVVQTLIMFSTFLLIIVKGTIDFGGPSQVIKEGMSTGFFSAFSFRESANVRYTIWGTVAAGINSSFRDLCISQAGVQRILSVKDTKSAQKSTMASAALGLVFMMLLFISSLVLYVNLHNCDPLMRKKQTQVTTPDQIFVYGLAKILKELPGLTGIALAGVLSGSISSFSSHINAFAAITLEDYLKPFLPRIVSSEKKKVFICKVLTSFYGVLSILFALMVPYLGGAVQATISIMAVVGGPLAGVIFLAILVKRYNTKACYIGLGTSVAVCIFLQICYSVTKPKHDTLPRSVHQCPIDNDFLDNILNVTSVNLDSNNNRTTMEHTKTHNKSFSSMFSISFMWFGPIGVVTSVIVGYVASLFSGNQDVDPLLLRYCKETADRREMSPPLLTCNGFQNEKIQENGV